MKPALPVPSEVVRLKEFVLVAVAVGERGDNVSAWIIDNKAEYQDLREEVVNASCEVHVPPVIWRCSTLDDLMVFVRNVLLSDLWPFKTWKPEERIKWVQAKVERMFRRPAGRSARRRYPNRWVRIWRYAHHHVLVSVAAVTVFCLAVVSGAVGLMKDMGPDPPPPPAPAGKGHGVDGGADAQEVVDPAQVLPPTHVPSAPDITLSVLPQGDEHLDHGVQHDEVLEARIDGQPFDKHVTFRVATSNDIVTASSPVSVRPNTERQIYEIRPVQGDFKAGGYRLIAMKSGRSLGVEPAFFNVEWEPTWDEMVEGSHPQSERLSQGGAVVIRDYETANGGLKPRVLLDPKVGSSASVGFPTDLVFATVRAGCVWHELVFVDANLRGKLTLSGLFDLECRFDWTDRTVTLLQAGNAVTRGDAMAKFKLPDDVLEGLKLRVGIAWDGLANAVIALGKPKTPTVLATVRLSRAPVLTHDQHVGVETLSDPVFVLHSYASAFPRQLNEGTALNIMR